MSPASPVLRRRTALAWGIILSGLFWLYGWRPMYFLCASQVDDGLSSLDFHGGEFT